MASATPWQGLCVFYTKMHEIAEIKKLSLTPHNLEQISRSAIGLPGNYARAVRLREMAIAADLDVPRYLLAPEISVLLSYLPDLRQRVKHCGTPARGSTKHWRLRRVIFFSTRIYPSSDYGR